MKKRDIKIDMEDVKERFLMACYPDLVGLSNKDISIALNKKGMLVDTEDDFPPNVYYKFIKGSDPYIKYKTAKLSFIYIFGYNNQISHDGRNNLTPSLYQVNSVGQFIVKSGDFDPTKKEIRSPTQLIMIDDKDNKNVYFYYIKTIKSILYNHSHDHRSVINLMYEKIKSTKDNGVYNESIKQSILNIVDNYETWENRAKEYGSRIEMMIERRKFLKTNKEFNIMVNVFRKVKEKSINEFILKNKDGDHYPVFMISRENDQGDDRFITPVYMDIDNAFNDTISSLLSKLKEDLSMHEKGQSSYDIKLNLKSKMIPEINQAIERRMFDILFSGENE